MNYCELTTYITALANIIAKNCTNDEINLLSAIFVQLGDTLTTIITQKEICCAKLESKCESSDLKNENI